MGSEPVLLNLGSWVFRMDPPWINIDLNPAYNPDVIADACRLPYEDNSVDEIYAGHILEHIPPYRDALKEWYRVLKPNSKIGVTVPDIERAIGCYRRRDPTVPRDFLNQVAIGGADDGCLLQMHQRVYTEDILVEEMRMAGFVKLKLVVRDKEVPWQTTIEARKPCL